MAVKGEMRRRVCCEGARGLRWRLMRQAHGRTAEGEEVRAAPCEGLRAGPVPPSVAD